MSNSISLPFLIIATGTILFVYMSVVIMELRSAYEESFWKQALKIGGIIFTLITLLFLGLDFVLTRFREKAFLLAPGMPILGIILVYMRSIVLAWRWRNWKYSPCGRLLCTITVGKSGKNSSLRLTAGEISWCSIKP